MTVEGRNLSREEVELLAENFNVDPRDVLLAAKQAAPVAAAVSSPPKASRGLIHDSAAMNQILELAESGCSHAEIAVTVGISGKTVGRLVGELQKEKLALNKYQEVQALHLTALQARILSSITEEKIMAAPLSDLVRAFKILKDAQQVIEGKPTEIKGLLGYLVQLEKEDVAEAIDQKQTIDVTAVPLSGSGESSILGTLGKGVQKDDEDFIPFLEEEDS